MIRSPGGIIGALVYLGAAAIIAAWVALGARLDNLAAAFCLLAAAFHLYFLTPKPGVPKSDLSSLITLAPLLILSGAVVVVAFYEPALKYAVMAFVGLSAGVFARDVSVVLRRWPLRVSCWRLAVSRDSTEG